MDILQAALLIGLAFILFLLVMLVIYYVVYTSSHPTPKPQQQSYQPPSQMPPVQYGYNASRIVLSSESDPAGAIFKVSMSCLVLAFTAAVILSCVIVIITLVIAAALGVSIIEAISVIMQGIEEALP